MLLCSRLTLCKPKGQVDSWVVRWWTFHTVTCTRHPDPLFGKNLNHFWVCVLFFFFWSINLTTQKKSPLSQHQLTGALLTALWREGAALMQGRGHHGNAVDDEQRGQKLVAQPRGTAGLWPRTPGPTQVEEGFPAWLVGPQSAPHVGGGLQSQALTWEATLSMEGLGTGFSEGFCLAFIRSTQSEHLCQI